MEDPGWPKWWIGLTPVLTFAVRLHPKSLVSLRRLLISFASAIVYIGVVVPFVKGDRPINTAPAVALICAVGIGAVAVVAWLRRRPLTATGSDIADGYRKQFFLKLAVSESVALVAFIAVIATAQAWVYVPGAAISLLAIAISAPTRRDVARHGPDLLPALLDLNA